ncbi:SagB/ThcOx family dehydrogenase [Dactylosporangium sp. NPDC000521]|uniref:SagB/ThcOx family dehydrogenase n=1 Tax=Dactylosporangium sp. NPDC000521 TaxID=3363975 RepID=UPI0036C2115B
MYVRRSPDIMLDWGGPGLSVYDTKRFVRMRVPAPLVAALAEIGAWTPRSDVPALVDDATMARLRQFHLVECADTPQTARPASTWERWGNAAAYFHAVGAAARYVTGGEEREELVAEIAADEPPAFFKEDVDYRGVVALPEPVALPGLLTEALTARRTCRAFTDSAVPLAALATLLHYGFRPTAYLDAGVFGQVPLRASPCAGGRNEIEAYVFALHVDGLESGLYHYSPRRHALGLLDPATGRDELLAAAFDQPALRTAPVVVATAAVLERVSYKYRHARAYRLLGYDAGHTGQTFALTATALGLFPYQSAAYDDAALAGLLRLDFPEEIPTYLLAAGHARNPDAPGLPG